MKIKSVRDSYKITDLLPIPRSGQTIYWFCRKEMNIDNEVPLKLLAESIEEAWIILDIHFQSIQSQAKDSVIKFLKERD